MSFGHWVIGSFGHIGQGHSVIGHFIRVRVGVRVGVRIEVRVGLMVGLRDLRSGPGSRVLDRVRDRGSGPGPRVVRLLA